MEINIIRGREVEWLKNLASTYKQEKKDAEKRQRDEAERMEFRGKEREEKFKEVYVKNIYPVILSYHLKLASVHKELNLGSEYWDFVSDRNESETNELEIDGSYIRFSLNEEEYLPPIEMEVRIKDNFPKIEWLQFKQVTKRFVTEKCEDFIMSVFQVIA